MLKRWSRNESLSSFSFRRVPSCDEYYSDAFCGSISFGYDAGGNLERMEYENGSCVTFEYEEVNELHPFDLAISRVIPMKSL